MQRMVMIAMVAALAAGCIGDATKDATSRAPVPCTPGDSEICVSSDGRSGTRICLGTVHVWSPCLSGAYCGDGTCDASDLETRTSCAEDCAWCGDGFCDGGEDRDSCSYDCLPVECVPDETYCAGSQIRRCASDGATSILAEDCAASAGGSTWTECASCASTGEVACGSSVAIVAGDATGTAMAESVTATYAPGECPGETCAAVEYDPTIGLMAYVELPDGRYLDIWIHWGYLLSPGYPIPFTLRNTAYPATEIYAWDGASLWQSWAQCGWCGQWPPRGSLTADWTGDLGSGTVVHLYGQGHLTPDWGGAWSAQSIDLHLLVM